MTIHDVGKTANRHNIILLFSVIYTTDDASDGSSQLLRGEKKILKKMDNYFIGGGFHFRRHYRHLSHNIMLFSTLRIFLHLSSPVMSRHRPSPYNKVERKLQPACQNGMMEHSRRYIRHSNLQIF